MAAAAELSLAALGLRTGYVPDVHPAEEIVVDLEILSFSIQPEANSEKREVRCG